MHTEELGGRDLFVQGQLNAGADAAEQVGSAEWRGSEGARWGEAKIEDRGRSFDTPLQSQPGARS